MAALSAGALATAASATRKGDMLDTELIRLGRELDALAEAERPLTLKGKRLGDLCEEMLERSRPEALRAREADKELVGFHPPYDGHNELWYDGTQIYALEMVRDGPHHRSGETRAR